MAGLVAVNAAVGADAWELSNSACQLVVSQSGGQVRMRFQDKLLDLCLADGPYLYAAQRTIGRNLETFRGLQNVKITGSSGTLVIRGKLAGLDLEHRFTLSTNGSFLEEQILLRNPTAGLIALSDFEAGFLRRVTDKGGAVLPELAGDRWVAVPWRVHAQYPKVLIELHDPVAGGNPVLITPVYYKYGLPGSYDENWGFEMMWDPMADLKEDRARALYFTTTLAATCRSTCTLTCAKTTSIAWKFGCE